MSTTEHTGSASPQYWSASLADLLAEVEPELVPGITRDGDGLASLLCFASRSLLQSALRRNRELALSVRASFKAERPASMFIDARASIEVACLASDVVRRIKRLAATPTEADTRAFAAHILNAKFGCRVPGFIGDPSRFSAPNVLTIIDNVAKDEFADLRFFYDGLSEFAHPNWPGMDGLYAVYSDDMSYIAFPDKPAGFSDTHIEMALGSVTLSLRLTLIAWHSMPALEGDLAKALESISRRQADSAQVAAGCPTSASSGQREVN